MIHEYASKKKLYYEATTSYNYRLKQITGSARTIILYTLSSSSPKIMNRPSVIGILCMQSVYMHMCTSYLGMHVTTVLNIVYVVYRIKYEGVREGYVQLW